jgi:sulfide:quinone oxidoreductase
MKKKLKVVVLGAGFGGLEMATILSNALKEQLDLTLIDKNQSFYFGYTKLDVMFGRRPAHSLKHAYGTISKQGVSFRLEDIQSIDPVNRRVITDSGKHNADVLVVALGEGSARRDDISAEDLGALTAFVASRAWNPRYLPYVPADDAL